MSNSLQDFTKIWIIEDFCLLSKKNGEFIKGLEFDTELFHKTQWCLVLFPRGEDENDEGYMSCFLQRSDNKELENIEIEFEMSVNSEVAKMKHSFQKKERSGFHKLVKRESWISSKENNFVLKCHMRMVDGNLIKNKESSTDKILKEISSVIGEEELKTLDKKIILIPNCSKERRICDVRRRVIECPIENIISPLREREPQILLTLYTPWLMFLITIGSEDNADRVKINIRLQDKNSENYYIFCKVDLLDSNNEIHASAEDDHLFKGTNDIWNFQHPFLWENLKTITSGSIRFEFYKGSHTCIDACYATYIEPSFPTHIEKSSNLKKEIFRFYKESKFCDVSLHTTGKSFGVHKNVLAAMSPVFDAMFESNMSEGINNIIHIDDLDSGTVALLLDFMYTESIELLDCASAMKLFSAADKYQINSLKNICRNFLQNNLSVQNVCPILSLADAHNDMILKKSIIHYIHYKKNDVLCSSQWKMLADNKAPVALEILQEICLKFS